MHARVVSSAFGVTELHDPLNADDLRFHCAALDGGLFFTAGR